MVHGRYETEFAKLEPSCTTSKIIRDPRLIRRPAARVSQEPEPPQCYGKQQGDGR